MKQEAIVKHFENSNEVYYIKIRKTVEEKVISILSNSKMLLKLAFLSLTESMRKDPDRYISLIYHNNISSTADYSGQYYDAASYGQQQQYPSQDCISMLLEEAEKLYNKLSKELVDESISDYAFSILSSLPMLQSPSDEKEQQVIQDKQQQLFRVTCIQKNIDLFDLKLIMRIKIASEFFLFTIRVCGCLYHRLTQRLSTLMTAGCSVGLGVLYQCQCPFLGYLFMN